nr:hypothetical protein CFP56_73309 [Quercus suber]
MWSGKPNWTRVSLRQSICFTDLLGMILTENNEPELFGWVVWDLWNRRNNLRLGKAVYTFSQLLQKAVERKLDAQAPHQTRSALAATRVVVRGINLPRIVIALLGLPLVFGPTHAAAEDNTEKEGSLEGEQQKRSQQDVPPFITMLKTRDTLPSDAQEFSNGSSSLMHVNQGIVSSPITLQSSTLAENGKSIIIEAAVEPTDKVIDSPFMAKSNDDAYEIQPNDAHGAHENPSSSPHSNQRQKITKWSRLDKPENKQKIQSLVEKKDGGKWF